MPKPLREAVAKEVATKADVEAGILRLENRFDALDRYLDSRVDAAVQTLRAEFETRFQRIEARMQLLTWMVGFNLAATMAVLWKLLR